MTKSELQELALNASRSGRWMVWLASKPGDFTDNKGVHWNPVGEWTVASDWDPSPFSGKGLYGQGVLGGGSPFLNYNTDNTLLFCETDNSIIPLQDEIKCRRARILLVNELPSELTTIGSLSFQGCSKLVKLSAVLKTVMGLNLSRCTGLTFLSEGIQVGESLNLSDCTGLTALPGMLQVGSYLDLCGCTGFRPELRRRWRSLFSFRIADNVPFHT